MFQCFYDLNVKHNKFIVDIQQKELTRLGIFIFIVSILNIISTFIAIVIAKANVIFILETLITNFIIGLYLIYIKSIKPIENLNKITRSNGKIITDTKRYGRYSDENV